MPRLLALDWDDTQARYVIASTRDTRVVIEAAGVVEVPAEGRLAYGPALAAALAPLKIGRARTLVAVDRSQVELLTLSLPPCSNAELPELVRMQATRESSVVTDDTVLDFVPLSDDPSEPRRVAAAALSRDRLQQIQSIAAAAGAEPDAILLRPYAAAALVAAWPERPAGACLLINALADEVDLCLVRDERVIMWRTLRQSNAGQDPAAAKKLFAEIQRTLLVAVGAGQEAISAICLFGTLEEHPALVEQLEQEFSGSVAVVDPFALVDRAGVDVPQAAGRFAALVGMLTIEAQRGQHAIDFLHPRKTPPPPDRRRLLTLAGSAAGLVVLLVGYQAYRAVAEVDAENEKLSAELDHLDDQFKQAGKRQKTVQAVRAWSESDVNWLDELRDLSLRFPSGRDVVLQRMSMSDSRNVGGNIEMTGVVRDPAIVSRIENSVRDKYHQINSRHVQERDQDKSYAWHFEAQLLVTPRAGKDYVSHLSKDQVAEQQAEAESRRATKGKPPVRRTAGER